MDHHRTSPSLSASFNSVLCFDSVESLAQFGFFIDFHVSRDWVVSIFWCIKKLFFLFIPFSHVVPITTDATKKLLQTFFFEPNKHPENYRISSNIQCLEEKAQKRSDSARVTIWREEATKWWWKTGAVARHEFVRKRSNLNPFSRGNREAEEVKRFGYTTNTGKTKANTINKMAEMQRQFQNGYWARQRKKSMN